VLEATIAGTVDDFDGASYAARLAAEVGVVTSEVHLTVSAASVVVVAKIRPATPAAIPSVEEQALALSQRPLDDASSRLGVTVEAMSAPYTEAIVLIAPSPPPPSPPPPGVPPPPPSPPPHVPPTAPHSVDMLVVVGAASGGGLVGLLVVGGAVAVAVVFYRRQTRGGGGGASRKRGGGSRPKEAQGRKSSTKTPPGKGSHVLRERERASSTEGPTFGRCGSLIEPSDSRHDSTASGNGFFGCGDGGGGAAGGGDAASSSKQDKGDDDDDILGSLSGIVTEGSGGGGGALPLGWEEFVAPGSGKRLYYCAAQDIHTTVRPKSSKSSKSSATDAVAPLQLEVKINPPSKSPSKSPGKSPPPPPPEAYALSPRAGGAHPTSPFGCVPPPPLAVPATAAQRSSHRFSTRASQRGSQVGGGNALSLEEASPHKKRSVGGTITIENRATMGTSPGNEQAHGGMVSETI